MELLNLSATDLFSYEHLDLDLSNLGLVLVEGENGAGKTSIFKALTWTLFGFSLTSQKADKVIRQDPLTRKRIVGKTQGTITISVDGKSVRVERYRQHRKHKNKLYLFIDGKDVTASSDAETQAKLDELLQLDKTSFLNVVMFPQNFQGFASATDAEQKAIFDRVLSLDRFAKSHERKKTEAAQIAYAMTQIEATLAAAKSKLRTAQGDIETLTVSETAWQQDHAAKVDAATKRLEDAVSQEPPSDPTLDAQIAALQTQAAQYERFQGVLRKAQQEIQTRQSSAGRLDAQIAAIQGSLESAPEKPETVPEFSVAHYQQSVEETHRCIVRSQLALERCEEDLARLRKDQAAKDATDKCRTCGQSLTQEAKDHLFGNLQDDIDSKEAMRTATIGELKCHQLAKSSTDRLLMEAIQYEVWQDAEKSRTELSKLQQDNLSVTKEINEFDDIASKASQKAQDALQAKQDSDALLAKRTQQEAAQRAWSRLVGSVTDDLDRISNAKSPYTNLLGGAEKKVANAEAEIQQATARARFLTRQKAYVDFWVHGFSNQGVKSLLLGSVTRELNSLANDYLSVLSGGMATVTFHTQTTLASGEIREKFRVEVAYAEGYDELDGVSGGELRRTDIAVLFALGDLASRRSRAPVHLRLLDEPFDNLDAAGKEAVVNLLHEKILPNVGTLLVMSHDEDLKSFFDQRILVAKTNGVSTIEHVAC